MEPQTSLPRELAQPLEQTADDCPWQIDVGRQRDGWIFALEPLTEEAIVARHPGSCRVPSVFVGSRQPDDFFEQPDRLPTLLSRVVEILTGLSADEVAQLGVLRAVDADSDRVLATTEAGSARHLGLWIDPKGPR